MALTVPTRSADPAVLRRQRRLGLVGSLLMAIGALGAGALPAPNPFAGIRVLGLPARLMTPSLALVYAGAVLLVVAWARIAWLLRSGPLPDPARAHLAATAVGWALPLAVAPPLFSRDVYVALAHGGLVERGLDPYTWGPAALGLDDPLVRGVAAQWREPPSPYGPLWSVVERVVVAGTGADPLLGVLGHRVVAMVGLVAIAWAVPRLAARCGVDPVRASWWGTAHPLVLFHLVSAVHPETLMLGLALVGLELTARAGRARWIGMAMLAGATMIKLPMVVAPAFVGAEWAHRRGGRVRDAVAPAAALLGTTAGVAVLCAVVVDALGGRGWGWLDTLDTPGAVVTWMSLASDAGLGLSLLTGQPGLLPAVRTAGLVVGSVCVLVLLVATLRGRRGAVAGTAVGLGTVLLFSPVVQPWYLLWALLPLVTTGAAPRWTPRLVLAAAVVALVDVPTGDWYFFRGFQLVLGVVGGVAVAAAVLSVDRMSARTGDGVIDGSAGRGPADQGSGPERLRPGRRRADGGA